MSIESPLNISPEFVATTNNSQCKIVVRGEATQDVPNSLFRKVLTFVPIVGEIIQKCCERHLEGQISASTDKVQKEALLKSKIHFQSIGLTRDSAILGVAVYLFAFGILAWGFLPITWTGIAASLVLYDMKRLGESNGNLKTIQNHKEHLIF